MKPDYIFPFLWLRDQSEETLRTEIEKIAECGIRSICVESRPHPDFGGDGWWKDMDIILDEAEKRDMKIWILDDAHFPTGQANALLPQKYPERARKYLMMQHTDCAGPIACATLDVNLMMTKAFTWLDFGKPVNKPLMDKNTLISVVAVPVVEQDILADEAIDLTFAVKDGLLTWNIPAGVWRVCVCFETYNFGARNEYINYIDSASVDVQIEAIYEPHYQHYKEKFGKTIAGFFSDEPGFYNVEGFDMGDAIGRKPMALPWCDEFIGRMEQDAGEDWKVRIPQLWYSTQTKENSAQMRKIYMDHVSDLYRKNFSDKLGKWCEDHGVEYIGHVIEDGDEHTRLGCGAGHYFRAMSGQHMAGIDNIGGQIIPGNPYASRHGIAYVGDGRFYHYVIGKMGASSAQIDPKKKGRLLCETFGAYGWSLGVKNMKWIADFLLTQGVNHFVPHAFSMADYPDDDCPPHFYAGGHNPQFPYFVELMKYVNEMCEIFNGGQNVPQVGLLYPAEADWMDACMTLQTPARELAEHQIDFEILPLDIFTDRARYRTKVEAGQLVVNNRTMRAMIVPYAAMMDSGVAEVLCELLEKEIPVFFVDGLPSTVVGAADDRWKKCFAKAHVVDLVELAATLSAHGIYDISLENADKNLAVYHYRKAEQDIYLLFNTSLAETVKTSVAFQDVRTAARYLPMKKEWQKVSASREADVTRVALSLEPYESQVLVFGAPEQGSDVVQVTDAWNEEVISGGWYVSAAVAPAYEFSEQKLWETLTPYSDREPQFSGVVKYNKKISVESCERIVIEAEHIYENAELFVNGISAGKKLTPPYRWDLSGLCVEGDNCISIEVTNTPVRDTLKNPGIFGAPREMLEPSGMFGKVVLMWIYI